MSALFLFRGIEKSPPAESLIYKNKKVHKRKKKDKGSAAFYKVIPYELYRNVRQGINTTHKDPMKRVKPKSKNTEKGGKELIVNLTINIRKVKRKGEKRDAKASGKDKSRNTRNKA